MRIAIVGPGRMGMAVKAAAHERGHHVVAEIDIGALAADAVENAEVAIEFTAPDAAGDNLLQLASFGLPTVCGTTAWYDRLPEVRTAFERAGVGLVYAPNFSIGVQILMQVARHLAAILRDRPEFDAHLLESHHRHKKDAPSGTARALQDVLRGGDPSRDYPITSIRAGEIPGTHEIRLDALGEAITVTHAARDRTIFARGAVVAAEWLVAEPRRGVYRFDESLFGRAS
jgi:4-hydroxy-tetrahydrodipicolinate reductase